MTKKFNERVFNGEMIWQPLRGSRGIRRRWVWDQVRSRYGDPKSGPCYEARRVDPSTRSRVTKTFPNLAIAREWRDRIGAYESKVQTLLPKTSHETNAFSVSDLVQRFRAKSYPDYSVGTRIHYDKRFTALGPLMIEEVEDLTPRKISEWISWLTSPEQLAIRRKSRRCFTKELTALQCLLNFYIEFTDEAALRMPIKKKHFEEAQIPGRKKVNRNLVMNEGELATWLRELAKIDGLFYAMGLIQVSLVLRISEVCAMKWSNLDLRNKTYRLSEHVVWPRSGGQSAFIAPGTKCDSGALYMRSLWDDTVAALKQIPRTSCSDLIFSDSGKLMTYRQVQYAYDLAFKRAGLPHRGTHVCRHTGATLNYQKTRNLPALQQMGGWSNQQMAQHYAKLASEMSRVAIEEAGGTLLALNRSKVRLFSVDGGMRSVKEVGHELNPIV